MTAGGTSAVGPQSALLQLATALAVPETRLASARALAREFGGDDLLIFLRDEDVNLLLPAPGFPQRLPNGRVWTAFLEEASAHGQLVGKLPVLASDQLTPVAAVGHGNDIVFVVTGVDEVKAEVEWFRTLMPMFATIFGSERVTLTARAQEKQAREAAARAAQLTQAVDHMRRQLEETLAASHAARHQLEAQSEELLAQTEELQHTMEDLAKARTAAEAANKAKSEFLATMSHELRTPLNAIGGHVQLLELGVYGPITEEQRTALERVDRSQRHLLGLINNILNLSRIEAGRVDFHLGDVSLGDALIDLQPMIEPQMVARNIGFEIRDVSSLPKVHADREKLQQILLNLLSNAVKFTDPGGRVWVDGSAVTSPKPQAFIRVCDTGQGIPSDKLEFIFEPFTQVDSSPSRSGQGTGLGLAISRDLARGMGGDLNVRSTLQNGSCFTLSLPLASTVAGEAERENGGVSAVER